MIDVIRYNSSLKAEWDNFVDDSRNGTLFHKQKFISYHPPNRFKDYSLIFKKKNNIVSVFPAALQMRDDKKVLRSHPGTSYGGPVISKCSTLKDVLTVVDEILNFSIENNFDIIEMRLSPRIFHLFPSEELEYVLWYKGFRETSIELSSVASLCFETKKSLINRFASDTLRSIKKAQKAGVVTKESDNWLDYWSILSENLLAKHSTKPTHSLDEIIKLRDMFPNEIRLFVSCIDNKIVAGVILFVCNKITCHTFYIAQDYNFQNMRPLNVLFYNLLLKLHEEGFRYLNFGISTEAGGTIINPGLFRFKEGFGGTGVVRRYYSRRVDYEG